MPTTEYRAFVRNSAYGFGGETPPEPPPPSGTYPYFGSSAKTSADFTSKQTQYGGMPVVRRFLSGGDGVPNWTAGLTGQIVTALPPGSAICISFKDFNYAALVTAIKTAPAKLTVFLTYHHEPEDEVSDSAGPNDPFKVNWRTKQGDMRRAWVDAGKPANVKLGSILMGFTFRTRSRDPEDWWVPPISHNGTTYPVFDFIGCDQYDPGYKTNSYSSFANLNTALVNYAAGHGLPIGFGEVGSAIGPKRTTDLVARRAQIKGSGDWCVANAGTAPGEVWFVCYWDVSSIYSWKPTDPEYNTYGPIAAIDYRIDLDPPLLIAAPGSPVGQVAYGGPDPQSVPMWKKFCDLSRAARGITYQTGAEA